MALLSATAIDKVRERTESNMDALITILRGGPGVLDRTTGRVSGMSNPVQIYGDPVPPGTIGTVGAKARVHGVSGQGSLSLGPGQIDVRQVQVSAPWTCPQLRRDDVVLVRSAGQDTQLAGAALRVVEVAGGSLFGDARVMSCTLWGKSETWDGVGT